jgi:hypothetical protein
LQLNLYCVINITNAREKGLIKKFLQGLDKGKNYVINIVRMK